jgi:hypothetical protein
MTKHILNTNPISNEKLQITLYDDDTNEIKVVFVNIVPYESFKAQIDAMLEK